MSATIATICYPGSEPKRVPVAEARATLTACAFLREPVSVIIGGVHIDQESIPKPSNLTPDQIILVVEHLLHGIYCTIADVLAENIEIVRAMDGWIMEVSDGWTIWPEIDSSKSYRSCISWTVYDPDGNPLVEKAREQVAVTTLAQHVVAHQINKIYCSD
jgi:hypothetical protein